MTMKKLQDGTHIPMPFAHFRTELSLGDLGYVGMPHGLLPFKKDQKEYAKHIGAVTQERPLHKVGEEPFAKVIS